MFSNKDLRNAFNVHSNLSKLCFWKSRNTQEVRGTINTLFHSQLNGGKADNQINKYEYFNNVNIDYTASKSSMLTTIREELDNVIRNNDQIHETILAVSLKLQNAFANGGITLDLLNSLNTQCEQNYINPKLVVVLMKIFQHEKDGNNKIKAGGVTTLTTRAKELLAFLCSRVDENNIITRTELSNRNLSYFAYTSTNEITSRNKDAKPFLANNLLAQLICTTTSPKIIDSSQVINDGIEYKGHKIHLDGSHSLDSDLIEANSSLYGLVSKQNNKIRLSLYSKDYLDSLKPKSANSGFTYNDPFNNTVIDPKIIFSLDEISNNDNKSFLLSSELLQNIINKLPDIPLDDETSLLHNNSNNIILIQDAGAEIIQSEFSKVTNLINIKSKLSEMIRLIIIMHEGEATQEVLKQRSINSVLTTSVPIPDNKNKEFGTLIKNHRDLNTQVKTAQVAYNDIPTLTEDAESVMRLVINFSQLRQIVNKTKLHEQRLNTLIDSIPRFQALEKNRATVLLRELNLPYDLGRLTFNKLSLELNNLIVPVLQELKRIINKLDQSQRIPHTQKNLINIYKELTSWNALHEQSLQIPDEENEDNNSNILGDISANDSRLHNESNYE